MDKKGNVVGGIIFVVSIAAFAIFLLIVGFIGNTVGTELKTQINSNREEINDSLQTTITISTEMLSTLWYIMFGGLLFGVLVSAWFMRTHPVFVPIFIILLVVSIIVGVAMSNAYEKVSEATELLTAASQQSGVGFFMSNLPYIALIVGLIAILITFIKPGGEEGGGGSTTM